MSLRKENSILILLGAGASAEAGIPVAREMIDILEKSLKCNLEWKDYRDLYNFVKSAIYFADGIDGRFNKDVNYNIERLVNTLSELDKKIAHPLYPFIGSWSIKLTEFGSDAFDKIKNLLQMILKELQHDWVLLSNYSKSNYYQGLFALAKDFQYPLRVFSLNYDLCIEKNKAHDELLEIGFGDGRIWDWRNFDPGEEVPNIYLYKLHGSIDWFRDENGFITYSDEASKIKPDQLEIIFGTDYKLQYIDPFLFYAYQFRQWTLQAKLIIAVGYGFGDEHINGILGQALTKTSSSDRKLLSVGPYEQDEEAEKNRIAKKLKIDKADHIEIKKMKASKFMGEILEGKITVDKLNEYFPEGDDIFNEIH